jgi:predicted component of type VI protein secretion system
MPVVPDRPAPPTADPDAELVARFLAGRLDAARWDHRAHLLVCHHLLAVEGGPVGALARLRPLIRAHNARVGTSTGRRRPEGAAQASNGYHETITRYFVGAVHHAAPTVAGLLAEPTLARTAPGRHWSPTALGSPDAATGWVPPDRAPLPWVWPPG